jgi:hypothetical protein
MTLQEELNVLRASILGAHRQLQIATLRLTQIEAQLKGDQDVATTKQSLIVDPELFPMDSPQIRQEREPGSGE